MDITGHHSAVVFHCTKDIRNYLQEIVGRGKYPGIEEPNRFLAPPPRGSLSLKDTLIHAGLGAGSTDPSLNMLA